MWRLAGARAPAGVAGAAATAIFLLRLVAALAAAPRVAREEPLRRDADAASEPDLEERRRDDFTGASALGLSFRKDSLSTAESPITAPRRRAIAGWRSSSEPIATRGLVSYLRPHHSQKQQPVTTIRRRLLGVMYCYAQNNP